MLLGLSTATDPAPDLQRTKAWYGQGLGVAQ